MNDAVISVENLGKRYIIGHQRSPQDGLRHALEDLVRSPVAWLRGRRAARRGQREAFWALKDVSFTVQRGDVVGIIGRNGAGKSTLLKLLSRITSPTEGRIQLDGRVASLLEVGTGFHPELTGRENIFLNGAILGMTRTEIRRKFDEIVAFSEVEKFLDTPVKRYSSGMYVRLAFAVAAHLEPEILIVDEVLAVGDAQFQKKCLGKMRDVSAHDGRTVLFVSHNMAAVSSLCRSTCWLERGRVRQIGAARNIVDHYMGANGPSRDRSIQLTSVPRNAGDGRVTLTKLEWTSGIPLRHGEPVRARIDFQTHSPIDDLIVALGFSNTDGSRVLTYETEFQDGFRPILNRPDTYSVSVSIDSLPLAPGLFNLDIGCRSGNMHDLDYLAGAAQVEVAPGPKTPDTIVRQGAGVRLSSNWSWSQFDPCNSPAPLAAA